jgi:hypothetical protein
MTTLEYIGLIMESCRAECLWAVSLAFGYLLLPSEFLYNLGTTLLFYVFYTLLHSLTESLPGKENGYPKTRVFHWGLVGIIAVAGIIEWVLYVMTVVVISNSHVWSLVWKIADTATMIIRWLVSWEILAWSIVLAIKSVKLRADVLVREMADNPFFVRISLTFLGPVTIIRCRMRFFLRQLVYLVLFQYCILHRLALLHVKHWRKCDTYCPSHHVCVFLPVDSHMLPQMGDDMSVFGRSRIKAWSEADKSRSC